MGIEVREAATDAELEAWRQVRLTVLPGERARSVAEMRAMATAETLYLIATLDGKLAGSGLAGRSSYDYAGLHPRVMRDARRRGVGSALLGALADHAVRVDFHEAGTTVDDDGSLAFAERFGFGEVDRQLEGVRAIADEAAPIVPDGIRVVTVAERPDLWRTAYDPLALEAFAEMGTARPVVVSIEQWERDWLSWPEATYIALSGDEVVGFAVLESDEDEPHRAEAALTGVLRPWRRRGIATMLQRLTLAFAAANDVREVTTWVPAANTAIRALNARLGFVDRGVSITVRGPLPLASSGADRPTPRSAT
jgi:ribosomal protein S18 acetylase RimI-like enzyme